MGLWVELWVGLSVELWVGLSLIVLRFTLVFPSFFFLFFLGSKGIGQNVAIPLNNIGITLCLDSKSVQYITQPKDTVKYPHIFPTSNVASNLQNLRM